MLMKYVILYVIIINTLVQLHHLNETKNHKTLLSIDE